MTSTFVDRLRALAGRWRPSAGGTPSGAFGIVVGLLVGVMISALVFPENAPVIGVDGGANVGSGANRGVAQSTDGAPGAAGPGDPQGSAEAPTGAGPAAAGPAGGAAGTGEATQAGGGGEPAGPPVTLRVGVGVLDLGVIRNLGPSFDNGDGTAHMRAFLDGLHRDGLLPVNGYDVEFVYRTYDVLSAESQRAACRGFVQDDDVVAVLAGSNFQLGAECVAREFETPLLTSDALSAAVYERSPYLFTFMMSTDRMLRNWVHWADRRGELRDRRIGLFYPGNAANEDLARRVVEKELNDLGYTLTATATGSTLPTGGPVDIVAAQRFQAAGVEVVLMMGPPTAFAQQAAQQGYRPRYLTSDHFSGTTNTATSNVPPGQYDGALAMTGVRYGEWRAGLPEPERAATCAGYYAAASGVRIDGNSREAEWIGMNKLCDAGWALLDALRLAPPGGLDQPTLAALLESLQGVRLGVHDDASFGPGRHDGTWRQRTVQWFADCRCWKASGNFEPLFVP